MTKLFNTILLIITFTSSGISQTNILKEFKGKIYLNNKIVNQLNPNYFKEGVYVFYNPISISNTGDTTILCEDVFHYKCQHILDTIPKKYLIKGITNYQNNKVNGLDIVFNSNSIDSTYCKNDTCNDTKRTVFNKTNKPISTGYLAIIETLDTSAIELQGELRSIIFKNEEKVKNGVWVYFNNQGKIIREEKYNYGVLIK